MRVIDHKHFTTTPSGKKIYMLTMVFNYEETRLCYSKNDFDALVNSHIPGVIPLGATVTFSNVTPLDTDTSVHVRYELPKCEVK